MAKVKSDHPNAGIDLSAFYPSTMNGELYKQYLALTEGEVYNKKTLQRSGGLNREKQYIFNMYDVVPLREDRYPGVPNTPVDVTGFRLVNSEPRAKNIKTYLKHAIMFNAQVANGAERSPAQYYLLVQAPATNESSNE